MIRAGFALLYVTSLFATPRPAAAQEDEREEARVLFEQGSEAIRENRFREGRELLERSLALHENLSTRFNLAVATRRTGETSAAITAFEEMLEGVHGELADEQRVAIRQQLRETRAELSTILVEVTNVDRARVAIDGDPIGSVEGAALAISVDAGTHVVAASAPGRATERRTVEVRRGRQVRVELTLAPSGALGTLIVEADDGSARVQIVGGDEGTGLVQAQVVPGPYTVRVETSSGWSEREVTVRAGRTTRVELDTSEGDGGIPAWAWLAGGAAILAGAITATALILTNSEKDPVVDPVTGIGITLRTP